MQAKARWRSCPAKPCKEGCSRPAAAATAPTTCIFQLACSRPLQANPSPPHLGSAAHHAVGISASSLWVGCQLPRIAEQQAGALLLPTRRLQLRRKPLERRGGERHCGHHLHNQGMVENKACKPAGEQNTCNLAFWQPGATGPPPASGLLRAGLPLQPGRATARTSAAAARAATRLPRCSGACWHTVAALRPAGRAAAALQRQRVAAPLCAPPATAGANAAAAPASAAMLLACGRVGRSAQALEEAGTMHRQWWGRGWAHCSAQASVMIQGSQWAVQLLRWVWGAASTALHLRGPGAGDVQASPAPVRSSDHFKLPIDAEGPPKLAGQGSWQAARCCGALPAVSAAIELCRTSSSDRAAHRTPSGMNSLARSARGARVLPERC